MLWWISGRQSLEAWAGPAGSAREGCIPELVLRCSSSSVTPPPTTWRDGQCRLPSPYHTGQWPSALMDSADLISASYYNQPHSVNHARMLVPICKDFTFSGLHNTAHLFASIILFFLNLQRLPCHSYDCLSLHAMMCSATQMDRPRIVYAVSCV